MHFHGLFWPPGIAQVIYAHFQLGVTVHLRFSFPFSYADFAGVDFSTILAIVEVFSAFGAAKQLPMPIWQEARPAFFAIDHLAHWHLPWWIGLEPMRLSDCTDEYTP